MCWKGGTQWNSAFHRDSGRGKDLKEAGGKKKEKGREGAEKKKYQREGALTRNKRLDKEFRTGKRHQRGGEEDYIEE